MKLARVRLENFRAHRDTTIDFEDGITAIVGSNESGKSTVLEAIEYALFGTKAIRGKVGSIRSHVFAGQEKSPGTACVTLDFERDDSYWQVVRGELLAKLYKDDAEIAGSKQWVDDFLTKLLGTNLADFRAAFSCRQGEIAMIAGMKPMERQELFRRVFGLDNITDAVGRARKDHAETKKKVDAATEKLDYLVESAPMAKSLNERIAETRRQLRKLKGDDGDMEFREKIVEQCVRDVAAKWGEVKRIEEADSGTYVKLAHAMQNVPGKWTGFCDKCSQKLPRSQKKKWEADGNKARERVTELEERLANEKKEQDAKLLAARAEWERVDKQYQSALLKRKEAWQSHREIGKLEERLATDLASRTRGQLARTRIKVQEELLEELVAEADVQHKASVVLNRFRLEVAASIGPQIEAMMTRLVSILTNGRHDGVIVDSKLRVTLLENGRPTEVISGGTQDIVALAMRLTVGQLMAERSGTANSVLFLDEPFGSLDTERRNNVLELLDNLREVHPQVIMISHVEETRDMADHVIQLTHDGETAKEM